MRGGEREPLAEDDQVVAVGVVVGEPARDARSRA